MPAQGTNYLVPSEVIKDRVNAWKGGDEQSNSCGGDAAAPAGADNDLDVTIEADDPSADDIALSLYTHGDSINQGLYDAAWSLFTPDLQRSFENDVDGWSKGLASSYWDRLEVEKVTRDGDNASVRVALRTRQDPRDSHDGRQECSDWSMTYRTLLAHGTWFIDHADSGGGPTGC